MAAPPATEERGDAERGPVSWVEPFFSDPGLWPVLIAAVLSLASVGTAALLLALRDRNVFAVLAVVIAALASIEGVVRGVRRQGRLGRSGGLMIAIWSLSGLAAGSVIALGYY